MLELIVFEIERRQFALKAADVVEIIRAVEVTVVPETALPVVGIINYRGKGVPVIRLAHLLGLASNYAGINEHMVIVGNNDLARQVCLVVDQVTAFAMAGQLQAVAEPGQSPAPARIATELASLEGQFVPIINISALITRPQNTAQTVLIAQSTEFREN